MGRRIGVAVTILFLAAGCANLEPRLGSACLAVDQSVVAEIRNRTRAGVDLTGFVAVKAQSSHWEQLFFISARAGDRVATWVADDIHVLRRGPLPNTEPIILAANGAARAATPSLRYGPGAGSVAGLASQECLRRVR